ncbi:DUF7115 domain-containing protein [Halosolutus halophilus]|uniref:DUF7115 domain-containing protein n=1 Tax=Halosolutus halophilus TaxID=1552990 RepID=UPI0022350F44|nr:hypothetical protein [Halosolutus halophilus]
MSVPGIVQSTLDGEEISARVSLGGEDELFITPTNTIIYRADGLLSDESVDKFPHDADRLTLSEGRRKTKFTLEYALEGTTKFSVPASKTDAVLHPVLAGVLNGNGITDAGETVVKTYRFSELTLIITSDRLVKHIGEAVWDEDYEEYHFDDVTHLAFEDGSVATQIVLTVDGRPQRIKAPNDEANDCRERLKRALFEYHDVDSLAELNEVVGEDEEPVADRSNGTVDFGDGVDPLDADPPEPDEHAGDGETTVTTGESNGSSRTESGSQTASQSQSQSSDPLASDSAVPDAVDASRDRDRIAESDGQPARRESPEETLDSTGIDPDDLLDAATSTTDVATETAPESTSIAGTSGGPDPEILDRLEDLEAAVERQNDRIEKQQQTIEQLIAELRQGR